MSFIKHRIARFLLAAFIATASSAVVFATNPDAAPADSRTTISAVQLFPMNVASFENISPELQALIRELERGVAAGEIESLVIVGSASPDGPAALNRRLAQERAEGLADFIAKNTSLNADKISVSSRVSDWQDVASLVSELNESHPSAYAPLIVAAIGRQPQNPAPALRRLENGKAWKWLSKEVFPVQRSTDVRLVVSDKSLVVSDESKVVSQDSLVVSEEWVVDSEKKEEMAVAPVVEGWQRGFYLKTNLPAWLALITNVGVEVDLAPHWSFNLPFYYSGFNYFTSTLKFRILGLQPEVRWWPQARNHGFFAGAHFSMAYYNLAFNRSWRYQDHDGHTPALGGGIALGWRFRLNSDPNLTMEASVGAGAYSMHYDVFYNHRGGLLYDTRKKTYIGLDQAALSLTYRFGIGRRSQTKGGEK